MVLSPVYSSCGVVLMLHGDGWSCSGMHGLDLHWLWLEIVSFACNVSSCALQCKWFVGAVCVQPVMICIGLFCIVCRVLCRRLRIERQRLRIE